MYCGIYTHTQYHPAAVLWWVQIKCKSSAVHLGLLEEWHSLNPGTPSYLLDDFIAVLKGLLDDYCTLFSSRQVMHTSLVSVQWDFRWNHAINGRFCAGLFVPKQAELDCKGGGSLWILADCHSASRQQRLGLCGPEREAAGLKQCDQGSVSRFSASGFSSCGSGSSIVFTACKPLNPVPARAHVKG